eukprot:177663-Pleurochrysis_carterae.AAC.2
MNTNKDGGGGQRSRRSWNWVESQLSAIVRQSLGRSSAICPPCPSRVSAVSQPAFSPIGLDPTAKLT